MEFFIIENTNNKCHEIRFISNSVFTSYNTNVALKVQDILLINKYYHNYSNTTNRHLIAIENKDIYSNILYINNDLFNELIFLLEEDKETLYKKVQELETRNKYQLKDIETIKTGKPAGVTESTHTIEELKTRIRHTDHNTTPSGIKYQVITTYKKNKKQTPIKFKVKLEKYQPNLLSSY